MSTYKVNQNKMEVMVITLRGLIAFVRTHHDLVFLGYKGRNFPAVTGDCRLAAPINFIRVISAAGKWTPLESFSFPLVSFSCRSHAREIRRTRIHKQ